MRIEMLKKPEKDVYLTKLNGNEPGIYIGRNDHIWIVGRNGKVDGFFSSTLCDFCPLNNLWTDESLALEKIKPFIGDLVLRNVP